MSYKIKAKMLIMLFDKPKDFLEVKDRFKAELPQQEPQLLLALKVYHHQQMLLLNKQQIVRRIKNIEN